MILLLTLHTVHVPVQYILYRKSNIVFVDRLVRERKLGGHDSSNLVLMSCTWESPPKIE